VLRKTFRLEVKAQQRCAPTVAFSAAASPQRDRKAPNEVTGTGAEREREVY
jgi:hypothetical protein